MAPHKSSLYWLFAIGFEGTARCSALLEKRHLKVTGGSLHLFWGRDCAEAEVGRGN